MANLDGLLPSAKDFRKKIALAESEKASEEMRRRSAVEPVIGHMKAEHRMGRNYLWYRQGDAINAVLAAAGYNFSLLLRWLRLLLLRILAALTASFHPAPA